MSFDWMQKLAAGAPRNITKQDIHAKATEKGVVWDSGKPGSQDFLRMSMRVTGKTHLDEMDQPELRRIYGTLEKKADVVAHIAGPSGSGKTTLLSKLRISIPDLVVKDLDDFDTEARKKLGWKGVKKKEYTDEMLSKLHTARQVALNSFLKHNKDRKVVLGGHHIEGPNVTTIPEGHKFLLNTGALQSAVRNVRRSKNSGGLKGYGDIPRFWRIAGKDIKQLRGMGYVNRSPSQIEEALQKTAEQDGHWRRLKPGQTGHDQGGNALVGRTWVRKNRMKPAMKPMKHQADFSRAVKQQLGKKGGGGIIAAHGTGTGKTFSSINAFEELKGQGKAKRALVIAPAGLRANFLHKGVNKFTSSKGVILNKPQAVSADTEYVVVSYAAFRADPEGWVNIVKPDTIIADEVHRAANPGSQTYKALMTARKMVPNFMGLTASVVQNKPSEIVPLLALAAKGEQPISTQKAFKKKHVERETSSTLGIFGGKTYEQKLVRQAMLKAKVGASIHYIEDLDATKKPTKDVETVDVDMSSEQMRLYRMSMQGVDPVIRKKIAEGQPVSQKQAMNIFTRLMRARQVSNSLHLASPNMTLEQAAQSTPKIKRILDDAQAHIKKTPDAQIIMYTNIVHGGVDVLEAGLKARGISYGKFIGKGKGVTEETRQQAVADYQSKKNKVIIITGAGAEGLSLGNTTMVQLVDGHYNPERMSQAEARGVRAGGLSHRKPEDRRVKVRRYVSTLPKTFWQTVTLRPAEKSVGQWVYSTAGKKERLNKQLRTVLKDRSEHEKKKRDSVIYRTLGGGP
jgi:energy-coupling factor transporter ATP-binding protein EcfA2